MLIIIPGNATLHFTVECLEIADGVLPTPPPPPREKVSSRDELYQKMNNISSYILVFLALSGHKKKILM